MENFCMRENVIKLKLTREASKMVNAVAMFKLS